MRKIISEKIAGIGLLTILSLIVIFHFLVLLGIIPFEIVWGGRLTDSAQMIQFEIVSITLNLVMLVTVAIRSEHLNVNINKKIITVALWIMVGLFLLNTIGNLLSSNALEKILFTPLTILLAILSWRLAIRQA
jgi:hypothetical protein